MHLYLTGWVEVTDEAGTRFQPQGTASLTEFTAIDLRPDSTVPVGRCFLAVAARADAAHGGRYLGEDPRAALSAQVRNRIGNDLGVTLGAGTFDEALLEVLRDHADDARADRWNRLRPVNKAWEIWLGNERLVRVPLVAGAGVTVSDDFNRADSSSLGASWTEVAGDSQIVSNRLRAVSTGTACSNRYDTDLSNDNGIAEADNIINTNAASGNGGPMARFQSGADTGYYANRGGNSALGVFKRVTGTNTSLGTTTYTFGTATYHIRLQVIGSTVRADRDYDLTTTTVTDTAITTGTRTGIYLLTNTSVARSEWDNFAGRDHGSLTPPRLERRAHFRALIGR